MRRASHPLDPGPRRVALLLVALLGAAGLLVLKSQFLGNFLQERAFATLLGIAVLALLVARVSLALRVAPLDAALAAFPALALLVVLAFHSPLAYEMEAFAESVPRPEGASEAEAVVARPYDHARPSVQIQWVYPPDANATQLTREHVAAFEAGGWRTYGARVPGEDPFGSVLARRWDFVALCQSWDEPLPRIRCTINLGT